MYAGCRLKEGSGGAKISWLLWRMVMSAKVVKKKRVLPKPGRKLSFEEAEKKILKQFSGTFAKLAK
jgi:hypothetical protein